MPFTLLWSGFVPLWLAEPDPDFVIVGPDLLPGLPTIPAPLFVLDCATAIDEASIAASTIAIVPRMRFPMGAAFASRNAKGNGKRLLVERELPQVLPPA
jgi:hypothetical protein